MQRMDDAALLSHLNSCITGHHDLVRPPAEGNFLDVLLGNHEFHAGFQPMLDDRHILTDRSDWPSASLLA